jgi:hypothetical protein
MAALATPDLGHAAFGAVLAQAVQSVSADDGGLATRRAMGPLVQALLREPGLAKATWHPLGCLYIELFRTDAMSVRIHVWGLTDHPFVTSGLDIHAHDFDMRSTVLAGGLLHRRWHRSSGPPTHQVYDIEYAGAINHLRPSGRCLAFRPGPLERVHHVEPMPGSLSASFVVARLAAGAIGTVLGPLEGHQVLSSQRQACPAPELRARLLQLQAALCRPPAGLCGTGCDPMRRGEAFMPGGYACRPED